MFGQLFVGFLLTAITFGIYSPWFLCRMYRYMYSKISFGPTAKGNTRFEFTGTGGQFFVVMLVGGLLTGLTFGIYYAWFMTNLIKFFADNTVAVTEDGTRYQARYEGTGGQLFVTCFVGGLLTGITFGIYMPWFICKLQKAVLSQTRILENGQPVGTQDFTGNGGDLFGQYLVGMILTMITLGIYASWFQVRLNKFMAQNHRVSLGGRNYVLDFDGTGGELFMVQFVGQILTGLTLGIYFFWFLAKVAKYNLNHTVVREA